MPRSKKEGYIDWIKCPARGISLGDLEPGGLLVDLDHVKAEEIFGYYKKMVEFEKVVFGQFKARLSGHRKQVAKPREMAKRDAEAYRKDRLVHPRKDRNPRGEMVFDLHPAKGLLRMDVAKGLHKNLSPSELRNTRPAYKVFKLNIFKGRIYQEVRRQKFLNWLERQRQIERPTPSVPRSKSKFGAHVLEELQKRDKKKQR